MERVTRTSKAKLAAAKPRLAVSNPLEPASAARPGVDIEALARNAARMIEEGGKALAAYIKPREDGKLQDKTAESIADVVRTLGLVLEYWLADPQRATEMQSRLGKSFLELWAVAGKRLTGEPAPPVVAPDPTDWPVELIVGAQGGGVAWNEKPFDVELAVEPPGPTAVTRASNTTPGVG